MMLDKATSPVASHHSPLELYHYLTTFGAYFPLTWAIPLHQFDQEIQAFASDWQPYNPRKRNDRQGLSLTSLDGALGPGPDLDSLPEHNALHGSSYHELSFRTPTLAWSQLRSISQPLAPLLPYLGRSHLLRFGPGGHFPPHRDGQSLRNSTFRLLALLKNFRKEQLVIMIQGERVWLEPSKLYFMNTRLEHAVFSFVPDSVMAVFNVELDERAVTTVVQHMVAR